MSDRFGDAKNNFSEYTVLTTFANLFLKMYSLYMAWSNQTDLVLPFLNYH